MKKLELLPNDTNLLETYKNDTLGRNYIIHYFFDLLNSTEEFCSIAVDGNWGTGKTFFVKQTKMIFDAWNESSYHHNEEAAKIVRKTYLKAQSTTSEKNIRSFVSVYYDAWKHDNDGDPLLSIIYEILQDVHSDYSFKENGGIDCVKLFTGISDILTQLKLGNIVESLKNSSDPLAELKSNRVIRDKINEFLTSILSEHGDRLIVFVDELDRCKPSFAIKLLEQIKHYFDNENITFVFSVNTSELSKTIRCFYGPDFDANRYLDRFFDFRIALPKPNMDKFYDSLRLYGRNNSLYYTVAMYVIQEYDFELREITKYIHAIRIASKKYLNKQINFDAHIDSEARQFCVNVIVPILIGLKMYDSDLYREFVQGNNHMPLIDIISDKEDLKSFCSLMLNRNERFESNEMYNYSADVIEVSLEQKLEDLYNAIFRKSQDSLENKSVGKMYITPSLRRFVEEVSNMMSGLTDFLSSGE